jgi:predicted ribosome quality control (RQC) complex YloA/Tae2 family protein
MLEEGVKYGHGKRRPVMRPQEEETVVPFAPEKNSHSGDPDQLDRAGQTILRLLNKAAGVTEENSKHAIETAQRLSHQLRAAENRIAELEAEVAAYQEHAERAEQWLHRVYSEIEERFMRRDQSERRSSSRR